MTERSFGRGEHHGGSDRNATSAITSSTTHGLYTAPPFRRRLLPVAILAAPGRTRLFRRYTIVIVAVVGGALVLSSSIQLLSSYGDSRDAAFRIERAYAATAAERITSFIQKNETLVTGASRALGSATTDQQRKEFLRPVLTLAEITEVAYLDSSGREMLRLPRLELEVGRGIDFSSQPKFIE